MRPTAWRCAPAATCGRSPWARGRTAPGGRVSRFDREQYTRYSHCDPRWKNRGGESRQEARARIAGAVRDIAARHPGETVAVFSHGDIIRCLQAEVDGLPVEEMLSLGHCDNTGVTGLRAEGERLEILFRNDNSHLSDEISTLARQRWWKDQKNAVADANFWFRPLEQGDGALFCALHRETWTGLYGAERGYDERAFFRDALERTAQDSHTASVAMLGGPAGRGWWSWTWSGTGRPARGTSASWL